MSDASNMIFGVACNETYNNKLTAQGGNVSKGVASHPTMQLHPSKVHHVLLRLRCHEGWELASWRRECFVHCGEVFDGGCEAIWLSQ